MQEKAPLIVTNQEALNAKTSNCQKKNLKKKFFKSILIYLLLYVINIAPIIHRKNNYVYIDDYPTSNNPQKKQKKSTNTKIALCTMGKKENLYAKEFIEYYINLGVDHLYIYDDNDPNTEKISDIIEPKYQSQVTTILAKENKIKNQADAFTSCYKKNYKNYDWFIMIDMDEFLYLVNNTLEGYLTDNIFNKCDFIKINWVISRDNDLVYYDPRLLFERFKPPYIKFKFIKTIIRGNISDLKYWVHSPYISPTRNVTCNNKGDIVIRKEINFEGIEPINVDKAFFIHFRFKSTEELINKRKRGFGDWLGDFLAYTLQAHINDYFEQNKITLEKIEYIEKELNTYMWKLRIQYYFQKLFFI